MNFLHSCRLICTKSLLIATISIFSQVAFPASIPESDSDYYPDWSQILAEGNRKAFYDELLAVTRCTKDERKKDERTNDERTKDVTVAKGEAVSACQKKALHLIKHRNEAGESLLSQYMHLTPVDEKELMNVLAMLEFIGFDIYGVNSPDGDSALLHAAEKHSFNFIIHLLASIKKDHPHLLLSLHKMRTKSNELMADLMLERFPDSPRTAIYITMFQLAPDISVLKESLSTAYLTLKYSQQKVEL